MIAIDPGASGGIAFLTTNVGAFAMPETDQEIVEILRPNNGALPKVYLEVLVKYTGFNMRSSAMAAYAGNYGFVRGVLKTFGYPVVLVQPKAWQKAVGISRPKKTPQPVWKRMLREHAQKLFPDQRVTLKNADALLILEAARRKLIG